MRNRQRNGKDIEIDLALVLSRVSTDIFIYLGLFLFAFFFWLVPAWIESRVDTLEGNQYQLLVSLVGDSKIEWSKRAGIAVLIISVLIAAIRGGNSNGIVIRDTDARGLGTVGKLLSWLIRRFSSY